MPPKQTITREQILKAAHEIALEKGMQQITARNIAAKINCSTQPIYWCFDNKEDLLHSVYKNINQLYINEMFCVLHKQDVFIEMTKWLINITKKSRYLFSILFYYNGFDDENLFDIMRNLKDDKEIIFQFKTQYQLGDNGARYLYIWCSNVLWASVDRQIGQNSFFKDEKQFLDFVSSWFAEFVEIAKRKD